MQTLAFELQKQLEYNNCYKKLKKRKKEGKIRKIRYID